MGFQSEWMSLTAPLSSGTKRCHWRIYRNLRRNPSVVGDSLLAGLLRSSCICCLCSSVVFSASTSASMMFEIPDLLRSVPSRTLSGSGFNCLSSACNSFSLRLLFKTGSSSGTSGASAPRVLTLICKICPWLASSRPLSRRGQH